MFRLKRKYHILLAITGFTIIFFLFQFLFIFDHNLTNSHARRPNPRFDSYSDNENNKLLSKIKNRIVWPSTNQPTTRKRLFKPTNRAKKAQIQIPLDEFQRPHLIYLLPFYHRNSFSNFSIIYVNEQSQEIKSDEAIKPNSSRGYTDFLNIESENRVVDVNLLRTYDFEFSKSPNSVKIRGVDSNKISLYLPNSNNEFQCLNSNVSRNRFLIRMDLVRIFRKNR
jgi:hypothetical protein